MYPTHLKKRLLHRNAAHDPIPLHKKHPHPLGEAATFQAVVHAHEAARLQALHDALRDHLIKFSKRVAAGGDGFETLSNKIVDLLLVLLPARSRESRLHGSRRQRPLRLREVLIKVATDNQNQK